MSRSVPLTVSLLLLAATPHPATAAEADAKPVVSFAEPEPLQVSLRDLEKRPAEVLLLNHSFEELKPAVAFDGPLVELDGDEPPLDGLLLASTPIVLPAAGSTRVAIAALAAVERPKLKPGTYPGFLVVTNRRPDVLLRRAIELTVAGRPPATDTAEPPPPVPVFDSWTLPFSRYLPFTGQAGRVGAAWAGHLPLAPFTGVPPAPPADPIGYLAAENRQAAAVHWTGIDESQARLELRGIDRFTSKYEGKIDFQPEDEAGEVTLTVEIQDHWLWAVACLALGIWVALRLEQFVQVRRGVWLARERNAQLGIDFEAAEERFRAAAEGGLAGFGIAADMEARRRRIRGELETLEGLILQAVKENPRFVAVQAELDRLEAAARSWSSFAGELKALDGARAEIRQDPPTAPDLAQGPEPACLALADALLAPAELTLEPPREKPAEPASSRFLERRPQVVSATALLEGCSEAERRVQQQRELIERLDQALDPGHSNRDALGRLEGDLMTAWDGLWQVKADAQLGQVATALDSTRAGLVRLAHHLPKEHPLLAPATPQLAAMLRPQRATALPAAAELADERERRDYYAGLRRRYEGVTLLVAFALAVISGLKALYIGHPFATPWHYVQALTWGAGTKLALDTVLAALGHLPALARTVGGGR